jgi:hypothetical protein
MGVCGKCHAEPNLTPVKETWYTLYRRLSGPQCRSEVQKISPQLGFDSWTAQISPKMVKNVEIHICPYVKYDCHSANFYEIHTLSTIFCTELHKSLDKWFLHNKSQKGGHRRMGGCDFYVRHYFLFH